MPLTRRSLVAGAIAAPLVARAQSDWPTRPGRIVVPYPAGGATDVVGRFAAEVMGRAFGQRFVVDNKGGASGGLGSAEVERAEPAGTTFLVATPATHVTNAYLRDRLPYDPLRFEPVAMLVRNAMLVVVSPSLPVRSMAELLDRARREPGKLNYGSAGVGATSHLAPELLKAMAKVEITHVPYRGAGPAMNDLLGGQIDLMIDHTSTSMPQVTSGRVRAIGVTSLERLPALPDVPTVAETVPGYEAMSFFALMAPKGTPRSIIERVNKAVQDGLAAPEIKEKLDALSVEPVRGSPEDLAAFLERERAKWGALIRERGIKET